MIKEKLLHCVIKSAKIIIANKNDYELKKGVESCITLKLKI